jgi:hypothetical protein
LARLLAFCSASSNCWPLRFVLRRRGARGRFYFPGLHEFAFRVVEFTRGFVVALALNGIALGVVARRMLGRRAFGVRGTAGWALAAPLGFCVMHGFPPRVFTAALLC